jgi:NTE family protein
MKLKIGLALGGGAAKGFAHIGVIKMLEASGIHPDVVSGTSAGSVVGRCTPAAWIRSSCRSRRLRWTRRKSATCGFSPAAWCRGRSCRITSTLAVNQRAIEDLKLPFAAVATQLETGQRTVFVRGNTGQAVRASSSIPGVFEPVLIADKHYVDGGVVSPVPVDAARQLGADFVIAVDISSTPSGSNPLGMVNIVGQSITIMGQQLGKQELARADVVIRPNITVSARPISSRKTRRFSKVNGRRWRPCRRSRPRLRHDRASLMLAPATP